MMTPILLKKKDEPVTNMRNINGGMKRGQELCVLVARSNVGKSKINFDQKIDQVIEKKESK